MNAKTRDGDHPALRGPSSSRPEPAQPAASQADETADLGLQIKGKVKRKSLDKLESLVEQHPEETLSTLRRWLHGGD